MATSFASMIGRAGSATAARNRSVWSSVAAILLVARMNPFSISFRCGAGCVDCDTGIAHVSAHHRPAEFRKLLLYLRRAGVVRSNPAVLRRKAKRHRYVERGECIHLPVEPSERVGSEAVGPRQPGTQLPDSETLHPRHRLVETVVLEMEPLAKAQFRRFTRKRLERKLRRAVLAQNAHAKVTVVGGAFRFLVTRGRLPGARQVIEAVPVDARRSTDKQFGGAFQAPRLDLFGSEAGNAYFGHPDWQLGNRTNLIKFAGPFMDFPEIPVEWKSMNSHDIHMIEHPESRHVTHERGVDRRDTSEDAR